MDVQMTQMNVRIPARLKAEGDEVLERMGWSASQAVREFWEFLVRNRDNTAAVRKTVLETAPSTEQANPEVARKLALAEEGAHIFERRLQAMGIAPHAHGADDDPCYERLLEEAYAQRYLGAGSW